MKKDLKSFFSSSTEDGRSTGYIGPNHKTNYVAGEPLSDEDPFIFTGIRKKRKTMQISDDEVMPLKKENRSKILRSTKSNKPQEQTIYQEIDPLEYFGNKKIINRQNFNQSYNRESESILSEDEIFKKPSKLELSQRNTFQNSNLPEDTVQTGNIIANNTNQNSNCMPHMLKVTNPMSITPQNSNLMANTIQPSNILANTTMVRDIRSNLSSKTEYLLSGIFEHSNIDIVDRVRSFGGEIKPRFTENTAVLIMGKYPENSIVKKCKEMNVKLLHESEFFDINIDRNSNVISHKPENMEMKSLPKVNAEVYANAEKELWVEKYKPKTVQEIVGQQGLKCPAAKLTNWLKDWKKNRANKPKNYFAAKEDGSIYKSVLISGPPGIGKSTTAKLVCQELGFDIVELNASDSRNKSCLDTLLSASLQSFRIGTNGNKSALIMDEVDGMSGNDDRGGIQEIISFIKTTHIPIICICNDRMHQKIRSLSNHCFDIRFFRPRIDHIKTYLNKIIKAETVNVDAHTLDQIISLSQNDIRSILNNLQMFLSNNQTDNKSVHPSLSAKDLNENIFEIVRKMFKKMDSKDFIKRKSDMFFTDYSLIPLFIQENYLITQSNADQTKKLENIQSAAENISLGDIVDAKIRTLNNWSLLPTQALFSTVLPAERVAGSISGMISFPQFLGQTSSANKSKNIIKELIHHSCLKCTSTRLSFRLDYLAYYLFFIYIPMIRNESTVSQVVSLMNSQDFVRQDWDNIIELCQWSSLKLAPIPTKTKSSFTRSVNKLNRILPYSINAVSKTKISSNHDISDDENLEEDHSDMVKAAKTPPVGIQKKKNTRKTKT